MTAVPDPGPEARTHISLNVADVERSAAFYEAFFGVPAHKRRPGYANFDLRVPPLKLALQRIDGAPRGTALDHLGIQMATREQVAAARERLKAAGLATFDEGETVCCYARQDKIWVTDPDGNRWEVYALLDDMPADVEETGGARTPDCCPAPGPCCESASGCCA